MTIQRISIVIDDDLSVKLHNMQGKAIEKTSKHVSFSDAVNSGLIYAIQKGFNEKNLVDIQSTRKPR